MKTCSFKAIAFTMNPQDTTNSLRVLWNQHRHIENTPISFKNICKRHDNSISKNTNFLCYNTWLLRAPFNDKPIIRYRAYLIGKELERSKYDLAALTEVFEEEDAEIIKSQSKIKKEAAHNGGGLYTLSQFNIIGDPTILEFENEGGANISDALAEKGVLHVELDTGLGHIDLYTTHLVYGDAIFNVVPSFFLLSETQRNALRLTQVRELRDFIASTHKPENIAIIAGDFNIVADADSDTYTQMNSILSNFKLKSGETIGFKDLWNTKGKGHGATENSYTGCKSTFTENGTVFCIDNTDKLSKRIDYVFIENPSATHNFKLDTTTLRRRPFPMPELSLSEILAMLDTVGFHPRLTLMLNPINNARPNADLKKLVNAFLIDEMKKQRNTLEESKQLSDHIGLDTKLLISPL